MCNANVWVGVSAQVFMRLWTTLEGGLRIPWLSHVFGADVCVDRWLKAWQIACLLLKIVATWAELLVLRALRVGNSEHLHAPVNTCRVCSEPALVLMLAFVEAHSCGLQGGL